MTGGPEKPRTGQYELSVALRRLSREVAKSNEQIENGGSFKGEDLCAAVDRFVDEFLRIPGAQAELERRAVFLKQSCGLGNEFHRLKSAAMEAYDKQPIKCDPGPEGPPSPTRLAVRDLHQLKRRVSVTLLNDLIGLQQSLKRARRIVVHSAEAATAFDALLNGIDLIRQDAKRDEVDGCHFLWNIYLGQRTDTRERWQRETILAGCAIVGSPYLKSLRRAAKSLRAWVHGLNERGNWGDNPTSSTSPHSGIVLTEQEQAILQYLLEKQGRYLKQVEIEAGTFIGRNTIGMLLNGLRDRGLTRRRSPRGGETITDRGRELLERMH
jgi:DNA-binding MarR family transcriptional regulator